MQDAFYLESSGNKAEKRAVNFTLTFTLRRRRSRQV